MFKSLLKAFTVLSIIQDIFALCESCPGLEASSQLSNSEGFVFLFYFFFCKAVQCHLPKTSSPRKIQRNALHLDRFDVNLRKRIKLHIYPFFVPHRFLLVCDLYPFEGNQRVERAWALWSFTGWFAPFRLTFNTPLVSHHSGWPCPLFVNFQVVFHVAIVRFFRPSPAWKEQILTRKQE